MSEEQAKAFLEKIKAEMSLQEKLKGVVDYDSVIKIAKEAGFLIAAEDLKIAQSELSDEELEGIAGGHWACHSQGLSGAGSMGLCATGCARNCGAPGS